MTGTKDLVSNTRCLEFFNILLNLISLEYLFGDSSLPDSLFNQTSLACKMQQSPDEGAQINENFCVCLFIFIFPKPLTMTSERAGQGADFFHFKIILFTVNKKKCNVQSVK